MEIINQILLNIIVWIESVITAMGPWGIALLMAIESCNIPLPSEAILPFAGYLVSKGVMTIHTAAVFGAIGCVIGSIPSYLLGSLGGRPFITGSVPLVFILDIPRYVRACARRRRISREKTDGGFHRLFRGGDSVRMVLRVHYVGHSAGRILRR